jgi:hypothetical protein
VQARTFALLPGLLISRRLVATSVERQAGRQGGRQAGRQAGSIIFSVRVREGECPPHEITMATPTRPATASCPACFHVLLAWRLLTSQSPQAKNDNPRLSCRQQASARSVEGSSAGMILGHASRRNATANYAQHSGARGATRET